MNRIELVGRLCAALELKQTKDAKAMTTFTLAVDRRQKEKVTDFIDCVAFENAAEVLCRYAGKGDRLGICGRLQTRTFETKEGGKRKAYEVVVSEFEFLKDRKAAVAPEFSKPVEKHFEKMGEEEEMPF